MTKSRITKEHSVRKSEILETSKKMFYTIGYEKTSVEMIINEIGIAKGTFYHYFKSKSDLLNELVKNELQPILKKIEEIKNLTNLNALEKFNNIIPSLNNWKIKRIKIYKIIFKLMYSEVNLIFRHKILELQFELFTPVYAEIIKQGIDEGLFEDNDPLETAELLILIGDRFKQKLAQAYNKHENNGDIIKLLLKHAPAYEKLINRLIGVKTGEIKIINPEILTCKLGF